MSRINKTPAAQLKRGDLVLYLGVIGLVTEVRHVEGGVETSLVLITPADRGRRAEPDYTVHSVQVSGSNDQPVGVVIP